MSIISEILDQLAADVFGRDNAIYKEFEQIFERVVKRFNEDELTLDERARMIWALGHAGEQATEIANKMALTMRSIEACGKCDACRANQEKPESESKLRLYKFKNLVSGDKDDHYLGSKRGWDRFRKGLDAKMKDGKYGTQDIYSWDVDPKTTRLHWQIEHNGMTFQTDATLEQMDAWRKGKEGVIVKHLSYVA